MKDFYIPFDVRGSNRNQIRWFAIGATARAPPPFLNDQPELCNLGFSCGAVNLYKCIREDRFFKCLALKYRRPTKTLKT